MRTKNIFFIFLTIIFFSICICKLSNVKFITPNYKKNIYNNVQNYIKDKYNENIKIDNMQLYSNSKHFLYINKIDEVLIKPANQNYIIYYDIKNNKIYDNKQSKIIVNQIKDKIVNKHINFNLIYGINELYAFQTTTTHFEGTQNNFFFDDKCFYNNDIDSFLEDNNINISLNISFKNSPNIQSYREICLDYINSIKPYFTGTQSNIVLDVYKENRYNNTLSKMPICEIYSYQNGNSWHDNIFEQNFINVSNGVYVSSLLNNYFFTSPNDCYFKKIPLSDKIKDFNNITNSFCSDIYYFNYTSEEISKYNIDTSTKLFIKLDKNTFEDGKLYNSNYKLYSFKVIDNNKTDISYEIINSTNSYTEGKYIYINLEPNSYLVLSHQN